jgi:hypothetical protein
MDLEEALQSLIVKRRPQNLRINRISISYLIAESNAIVLLCVLKQFWSESGGDELCVLGQFMDHR